MEYLKGQKPDEVVNVVADKGYHRAGDYVECLEKRGLFRALYLRKEGMFMNWRQTMWSQSVTRQVWRLKN